MAPLKMSKVEIDVLAVYDKLLMVQKVFRGGKRQAKYQHLKTNIKGMESYDSIKSSYIYLMHVPILISNLLKVLVYGFTDNLIKTYKSYGESSNAGHLLE